MKLEPGYRQRLFQLELRMKVVRTTTAGIDCEQGERRLHQVVVAGGGLKSHSTNGV